MKILPLGPLRWLIVGNGPTDDPTEETRNLWDRRNTVKFVFVDEREGRLPRIDRMTRRDGGPDFTPDPYFGGGTQATIEGAWTRELTTVWVDGAPVAATEVDGSLQFLVPIGLREGPHQVLLRTGGRDSNVLRFLAP